MFFKGIFFIFIISLNPIAVLPAGENSGIASRLLEVYISEKTAEGKRKGRDIFLSSLGGVLAGGSLLMMLLPDYLELGEVGKYVTWGTVAGAGAAMSAIGVIGLLRKPPDLRARYSYILQEEDAQSKEALAAAELQELAAEAGRNRIIGGFTILTFTAISAGSHLIAQSIEKERINLAYIFTVSFGPLMGTVIRFFSRSSEERIYDQYLKGGSYP